MSEQTKPETKKDDALDDATLDTVSGGAMKEDIRNRPQTDTLKA